ncbi:hypothetical protein HNQ79_005991 [Streptomyces candidus]|uniref:Uncharacterized protein n=1 Tax=Streptomyces candidus TaxID=67283 RepID=A0A7X0HKR6_9ACTN|nr:hypothetical protein [Streptomyces candidus]
MSWDWDTAMSHSVAGETTWDARGNGSYGTRAAKSRASRPMAAQVQNCMDRVASRYGGIDVACNDAGVGSGKLPHEMGVEEWDHVQATPARGVFLRPTPRKAHAQYPATPRKAHAQYSGSRPTTSLYDRCVDHRGRRKRIGPEKDPAERSLRVGPWSQQRFTEPPRRPAATPADVPGGFPSNRRATAGLGTSREYARATRGKVFPTTAEPRSHSPPCSWATP